MSPDPGSQIPDPRSQVPGPRRCYRCTCDASCQQAKDTSSVVGLAQPDVPTTSSIGAAWRASMSEYASVSGPLIIHPRFEIQNKETMIAQCSTTAVLYSARHALSDSAVHML